MKWVSLFEILFITLQECCIKHLLAYEASKSMNWKSNEFTVLLNYLSCIWDILNILINMISSRSYSYRLHCYHLQHFGHCKETSKLGRVIEEDWEIGNVALTVIRWSHIKFIQFQQLEKLFSCWWFY